MYVRLFYVSLDHRVMAVDVAPDGRLDALMGPSGSLPPQRASSVTLVLNFFSEVTRRTSP